MQPRDKIIETIHELLNDEEVSGYRIARETNIKAPIIHRLKKNTLEIENMKFSSVMTLYEFYKKEQRRRYKREYDRKYKKKV